MVSLQNHSRNLHPFLSRDSKGFAEGSDDSREIFAKQTGPICRCCRNDQVDHFCALSLFVAYQSKGGENSERILLIGCLNFMNSCVLEKFKGWNKPSERK